jgi:hypothetical protein
MNLKNTKKNTFERSYKPYLITGYEIPIEATMNNRFFWVVTTCSSGKPGASVLIFRAED